MAQPESTFRKIDDLKIRLWAAADRMRGHMDPAEYKHIALGLIFLKYISEVFQEKYDTLVAESKTSYAEPEDSDEYLAENIFWVPKEARWQHLQEQSKSTTIGQAIDNAMLEIERFNVCMTRVAVPPECLCKPRNLSKIMLA